MHEAWLRRDATHLKRGGSSAANDEDGRAPLLAAGRRPASVDPFYALNATPSGTTPVSA